MADDLPKSDDLTNGTSGPVQSSEPSVSAGRIPRPYSPERIGGPLDDLSDGAIATLIATKCRDSGPLDELPEFFELVRARLVVGEREYGDRSFAAPSPDLCEELEEELLDVIGWAYPLWCRIRTLRAKLAWLESQAEKGTHEP